MTVVSELKDDGLCVLLYPEDIDILECALKDYYFKIFFNKDTENYVTKILEGIGRL